MTKKNPYNKIQLRDILLQKVTVRRVEVEVGHWVGEAELSLHHLSLPHILVVRSI